MDDTIIKTQMTAFHAIWTVLISVTGVLVGVVIWACWKEKRPIK